MYTPGTHHFLVKSLIDTILSMHRFMEVGSQPQPPRTCKNAKPTNKPMSICSMSMQRVLVNDKS
ncbi:hypothetical protein BDF14DRAFT_1773175 [Spinellus fusiger]|nr:hypothetical protein BDF14DRAFT_1773175 [Spinellus fusiger]